MLVILSNVHNQLEFVATVTKDQILHLIAGACMLFKSLEPGTCTEGAVRLVDGVLEQEGRVELCLDGVWGSICGTGWDAIDGYVLCKQAGFDDEGLNLYTDVLFSTD